MATNVQNYPVEATTQLQFPITDEIFEASGFGEMLSNIPQEEKSKLIQILRELDLLESPQNRMEEVLAMIEPSDFENPFVKEDSFDDWALLLLQKGVISKQQMTTAMMHKAAIKDGKVLEKVDLFIGKTINPRAWEVIRLTLQPQMTGKHYITDDQLNSFFKKMYLKPTSEQTFFITKDPRNFMGTKNYSVSQTINLSPANFNALCTIGKEQRMSPTASMMEAMIQTKYGSNAGAFHFVFGLSSNHALLEGLKGGYRDVGIAHARFPIPEKADNHKASNWEFSYHDFFHLDAFSAIPEKHRLAFYELGIELEKIEEKTPFEQALYEGICDGEHPIYRIEACPNEKIDSSSFWVGLFNLIYKAAAQVGIGGTDAQVVLKLQKEEIFKKMAKFVYPRLDHFTTTLGLSKESIIKALLRMIEEFSQDFLQHYSLYKLRAVMGKHPFVQFVEQMQQLHGRPLV